jgi:Uma2 family endonuclease
MALTNGDNRMSISSPTLPELKAGDNLTREDFVERCEGKSELKIAELIGGIVYMPSPLSAEHAETDSDVQLWLGNYAVGTPGCKAGVNATWYMLADAPQPDAHLRIVEEYGGSSRLVGNFLHGAPELAAEICMTSAAYDLHQKLELYQVAGVREYVAFLLHEREVRWHRLKDGNYKILAVPEDGILKSEVFPGLWLDVQAFLSGDMKQVLQTLSEGMAAPHYKQFCDSLESRHSIKKPHRA